MIISQYTSLAHLEAKGLAKCYEAYAEYLAGENILEVAFNENSGYVYIALETVEITIGSHLGKDVEFICTDYETGEEFFFDEYDEALKHLDTLPA